MDRFERLATINIASLSYSLILVVVLICAVYRKNASNKRLLLVKAMALHVVSMVSRLIAWFLVRRPGQFVHGVLVLVMTSADLFSILTCIAIMTYVYTDVAGHPLEHDRTSRIVRTIWLLNAANFALALSNPWTGVYYRLNESNFYCVGSLFWLRNLLFFMQGICMVPVVVRLREQNGTAMTARLLLCGLLAVVSALFELALPGIALLLPAVSLMFVLLTIGVQGRLEQDLVQARADLAESRVRLLSGQINRHFVFNCLTAIKELISENQAMAEKAIQDFSDYLRSHLDVLSDARLVPFENELEHVCHYVALEQADPTVPLEVCYQLEATDFQVPPLTLQPLVENAIRHGILTHEGGGTVTVVSRRREGCVEVSVVDDGQGFSSVTARQDERRRIGIQNVRERLARQCGGTLVVTSGPAGTKAVMTIPEGADA